MIIDPNGAPAILRLVRPLGLALDEKELEAVAQWRFSPGMKDGRPVSVEATIEVNFKLLKLPGPRQPGAPPFS